MFRIRLYKYDSTQESNGYRGEEFSSHILQGEEFIEDISQELDTSEITLSGLSRKESFAPGTKFIVDIDEAESIAWETKVTRHLCVAKDMVKQPILSDDTYFDHHISFIEPSVVAQQRLVDNISITYKLKDVSLDETPAYPDDNISALNIRDSEFIPVNNFGYYRYISHQTVYNGVRLGKYFELEEGDTVKIINSDNVEYSSLYNNIENFATGDETNPYVAKFKIPRLKIMYGIKNSKNFKFLGYASIDYRIIEGNFNNNEISGEWTGEIISNSNLGTDDYPSNDIPFSFKGIVNNEWLLEDVTFGNLGSGGGLQTRFGYKKYTDTTSDESSYITQEIPLKPNKKYTVEISLHTFPDNLDITTSDKFFKYTKTTESAITYYIDVTVHGVYVGGYAPGIVNRKTLLDSQTSGSTIVATYDSDAKTIVYAQGTPYSALALIQKAILNTSIYEKKSGVYIADVNNSDLPFYIDDTYVDKLAQTQIIENFYNQKNLWEILIEAGNYIHAIPELKFGSNDRFVITFNELGRTDEKTDGGIKASIFNSRSVEDYISATSSYVTNMVQLGGVIEEWIAPKTTDEQYLVYNGTAEIITSKPIIELLEIKVRRNSDNVIADMTDFIYEENVYKTLSISADIVPNRGIAMYYSLGKNVITGGDYQLPQENTNMYSDYAIKKIIYSALYGYPKPTVSIPVEGPWINIKVQDYTFFIRYRTKDSVRQNHTRPDLRKYLINSKWDKFPEHNQFNNQQDIVVDSVKFGNNMFGKLIKTGNNSYEIWEWHDAYETVKHKGELYRINTELYYVAKATHYIYSSHILSKVEYSKDYNELSNIIGIPSEPRFYEISEQSMTRREVAINDFVFLADSPISIGSTSSNYVLDYSHLADLMFGQGTDFAKYAITVFKGDKDADKYNQTIGEKENYIEVINPINAYSSYNTLTYEWDMIDNYSAGDKVIDTAKTDYNSLMAVKYTDIYGKAALMDFFIIEDLKTDPTAKEIAAFPESPIKTRNDNAEDTRPFITGYNILASNVTSYGDYNGKGLGLLKDCREAISINYNLQMITSSDRFVLSPFLYSPIKRNFKVVLLANEVNKLSQGYVDISEIITPISIGGETMSPYFDLKIVKSTISNKVSNFYVDIKTTFENVSENHFKDTDGFQRVKAIAILCNVSETADIDSGNSSYSKFVVAKNISSDLTKTTATYSWYIGSPNKPIVFTQKQ